MRTMKSLLAATMLMSVVGSSVAQNYPTKPMTWIVPHSAGGPTDVLSRNIAERVSSHLGQQILIENLAGAGGTIGTAKVARSAADGYTFIVGHVGYMAAAPALYPKLAYDPVKDFDAVFRFPDTPMVMLVNSGSQFKSAADLINFAKQNPGKINFGNGGVGSMSHLVSALFAAKAGVKLTPVSYKGSGPALVDVIGGQTHGMFDQTNTALPQVKGGKVRAIATTSAQEVNVFPGVRPVADVIPGFEAGTWYGLYAPKGTPKAVIDRVYQAYVLVMKDKAFTERLQAQGIVLLSEQQYAPSDFQRHTEAEGKKWQAVIREANITIE